MAPDDSEGDDTPADNQPNENVSSRFDRLPASADERFVEGRATREEVLDFWRERFGVEPSVFEEYTVWERGAGKIWAFHGDLETPVEIEALGMVALRTRQEHWKPTLEAVQRFGTHASKNCICLSEAEAARFIAGEDQELDWDGDWGYLIVTHELAGEQEPLGVGLYTYGELKSMVPKGRRREL
jgi:NOL1/NOP2/fmu family ribosome biogenesis protein